MTGCLNGSIGRKIPMTQARDLSPPRWFQRRQRPPGGRLGSFQSNMAAPMRLQCFLRFGRFVQLTTPRRLFSVQSCPLRNRGHVFSGRLRNCTFALACFSSRHDRKHAHSISFWPGCQMHLHLVDKRVSETECLSFWEGHLYKLFRVFWSQPRCSGPSVLGLSVDLSMWDTCSVVCVMFVNQIRVILPFGLFIRSADQQHPNIIVTLTSCLHSSPFYLFGFSTAAACFQSDHSLAKTGSL